MRRTLLLLVSILSTTIAVNLKVEHEWKYVDYVWDSPWQRQRAINNGDYNASSCILYDVDKTIDGRTFVTAVREEGVPASVMTVSKIMGYGGPLLHPYPDWSWYRNGDTCNGITSVYRMFIKCNYLFILDCGKIGDNKICPPQLLIFDLKTDNMIKRIRIPDDVATDENGVGLLTTLAVSMSKCSDFRRNMYTVFMSDTEGFGLVIYNAYYNKFCRIESDSMKPTDTSFTIDGQSFFLNDGILGLTLVDKDKGKVSERKDRFIVMRACKNGKHLNITTPRHTISIFNSSYPIFGFKDVRRKALSQMAEGDNMYKVNRTKIQDCSLNQAEFNEITQLTGTLSGQTAPIASKNCAIFFSNIPETSILCADTSKKIDSNNAAVIIKDSVKLQFPSGMKIMDKTGHRRHRNLLVNDYLTVLTNKYQRVVTDTLNLNETNFRILSINMLEIHNETNCFHSCT